MDTEKLTEYADYLLQCAMYKVNNLNDAGDLVQETFLAALTAIKKAKGITCLSGRITSEAGLSRYLTGSIMIFCAGSTAGTR